MLFTRLSSTSALILPVVCLLAGANGVNGQEVGKWEHYAKDYAELTGKIPPPDADLVLAFVSKQHDRKAVRYVLSTGTSWNSTTYFVAITEQGGKGGDEPQTGKLLLVCIEQQSREVREKHAYVLINGVACEKPLPSAEVENILLAGRPELAEKEDFSPSFIAAVTADEIAEGDAPAGARWRLTCEKKLIDRAHGTARLVIYLSDKYAVLDSSVIGSIE